MKIVAATRLVPLSGGRVAYATGAAYRPRWR